ncbi:MAG: PEP-CTERM sorting domain-containing protein [Vitreoscilla sp.]
MKTRISALLATALLAIAPFAGAANVAGGAAVTSTGTGFGVSGGWCCGASAPLSTVTDGALLPVGTQWNTNTVFWSGDGTDTSDSLTITLAHASSITSLALEGDNNDTYSVSYLGLDSAWHALATISPNTDSSWGLGDGTATFAAVTATAFQITASGDGFYSVAEFQANGEALPAVPEPTPSVMLLAGLGALALLVRRRSTH